MATIVDETEVSRTTQHTAYPWTEWLDGQARVLVQGEDFTCSFVSFRPYVYAVARSRGVKVTLYSVGPKQWVLKALAR